jgi:hypothetical protein
MSSTLACISEQEEPASEPKPSGSGRRRVLVLSSSLLTDRMLLHSECLEVLGRGADVTVWATSAKNSYYRSVWDKCPAAVEEFPEVRPFKEFPYNYLRRVDEWVWDYRLQLPTRVSARRHLVKSEKRSVRALRLPGYLLSLLRIERWFEDNLEQVLLTQVRSPEAVARLRALRPDVVVGTGPFRFHEPAVVAAAKELGIPVVTLIHSWDNITTKNRMVFKYDGYLVWSDNMRQELLQCYPDSRRVPVYRIGAPQFDTFFQERFQQSREEFCERQGLSPDRPIILYALGSPNLFREHHSAVFLAERVARGELGDAQMIVRPHPIHDYAELSEVMKGFGPRVRLQKTQEEGTSLSARSQDESQIAEWVNTFRHADVVVNLSSTATIDAAIFDRPVVNLDFDPDPERKRQQLVKDINHVWLHFKPVAESGGVWLVNDNREMVEAVSTYLRRPELHREERRKIVKLVCGYSDGRCGLRMGKAILEFLNGVAKRAERHVG